MDPGFVPQVSILIAIGLTLSCIGTFIVHFVHHVPATINVGRITSELGRDLKSDLESLYSGLRGRIRTHFEHGLRRRCDLP